MRGPPRCLQLNQRQTFVTEATASALHVLPGRRFQRFALTYEIAEHWIADPDQPVTDYILEGSTVFVVTVRLEFWRNDNATAEAIIARLNDRLRPNYLITLPRNVEQLNEWPLHDLELEDQTYSKSESPRPKHREGKMRCCSPYTESGGYDW